MDVTDHGTRSTPCTAAALVNELVEAADDRQLAKTVARYGRIDLICLDELGYLHLDDRGAELLFQVLTEREERASIAVATNAPFSEWGTTFTDPRLAARCRPAHLQRPHPDHRNRLLPAPDHHHPLTLNPSQVGADVAARWGQIGLTFPLWPRRSEGLQLVDLAGAGGHAQLAQHLSGRVERDGGVRALWGSIPMMTSMLASSLITCRSRYGQS
jgi:hypothetical protein